MFTPIKLALRAAVIAAQFALFVSASAQEKKLTVEELIARARTERVDWVSENYYQIVESFDDFTAADRLMIPHQYRLQLNAQSSRGSVLFDWNVRIQQVMHNRAG